MPGARRVLIPARRTASLVLLAGLAAVGTGCGTAAPNVTTSLGPGSGVTGSGGGTTGGGTAPGVGGRVPARDSFQGSIRSSTGSHSGYTGRVRIFLRPQGKGLRRSVTIELAGLSCAGASHCLALSGTAMGALTPAARRMPDVGHAELLTGDGLIHPLGHVTIRGEVQGTGFIARGREVLTLTLTSSSGKLTLQAISPTVHGFTSP